MNTTVLVWLLVMFSPAGVVTISTPMASDSDCRKLMDAVEATVNSSKYKTNMRCVAVNAPK